MTAVPDESSKVDLVHRRLKEEIELGELAPGTPLSELSLVERTGASRTPVREALRRLAAEGLVDLVPRQGARVSRVSPQSVRDLFDFRGGRLDPAEAPIYRVVVRQARLVAVLIRDDVEAPRVGRPGE